MMARLETRADGVTYCIEDDGAEWVYAPAQTVTVDQARADKLKELQQARDNEIYSNFTSTALDGVTPKTYSGDAEALTNMQEKELQLLADSSIASVMWYNHEDGFVNHTRDQFLQLVKDNGTRIENAKMKYFQKEQEVNNDANVDVIQAVTW